MISVTSSPGFRQVRQTPVKNSPMGTVRSPSALLTATLAS
jgi:hypothetical protein